MLSRHKTSNTTPSGILKGPSLRLLGWPSESELLGFKGRPRIDINLGTRPVVTMHLTTALAYLLGSAVVAPDTPPLQPFSTFNHNIIYAPAEANGRMSYPRHTELQDGTLLVASSYFGLNPAAFPIFESKDGGVSWKWISNMTDQVNGWGMRAHPALMELLEPIGDFKPGTFLAAGNSASENGTRLDVYASLDKGRSWEFASRCAEGGRPNTTNARRPSGSPSSCELTTLCEQRQLSPANKQITEHTITRSSATTRTNAIPNTARNSPTRPPKTSRPGGLSSTT
jgi:hypothetical protein